MLQLDLGMTNTNGYFKMIVKTHQLHRCCNYEEVLSTYFKEEETLIMEICVTFHILSRQPAA